MTGSKQRVVSVSVDCFVIYAPSRGATGGDVKTSLIITFHNFYFDVFSPS